MYFTLSSSLADTSGPCCSMTTHGWLLGLILRLHCVGQSKIEWLTEADVDLSALLNPRLRSAGPLKLVLVKLLLSSNNSFVPMGKNELTSSDTPWWCTVRGPPQEKHPDEKRLCIKPLFSVLLASIALPVCYLPTHCCEGWQPRKRGKL